MSCLTTTPSASYRRTCAFLNTVPSVVVRSSARIKPAQNNRTVHNDINPRRRVRGPGLQGVVGRVPSRGGTFGAMYRTIDRTIARILRPEATRFLNVRVEP